MSFILYLSLWIGASLLTYIQFKRVVRRERSNPELLSGDPRKIIALNIILNTQLGHAILIIGSLIPIFWVMMLLDVIVKKQN